MKKRRGASRGGAPRELEAALARAKERLVSRERAVLGEKLLSLVEVQPVLSSQRYLEHLVVKKPGRVLFLDVGDIEWIEAPAST